MAHSKGTVKDLEFGALHPALGRPARGRPCGPMQKNANAGAVSHLATNLSLLDEIRQSADLALQGLLIHASRT